MPSALLCSSRQCQRRPCWRHCVTGGIFDKTEGATRKQQLLEPITEHQVSRLKTPAPPLDACLFTLILDIDTIVSLAPASLSLGLGFMWHQMANPDRCHNTCIIRPCKQCSVAGAQYWDPTHTSRKVLYNACSVAVLSARMLMLCSSAQWSSST